MQIDHNLLFGVQALQLDFIDSLQFTEACRQWADGQQNTLADLLVDRGWISKNEQVGLQKIVDRALERCGGDPRKTLGAVSGSTARELMASIADEDLQETLSLLAENGDTGTVHVDPPTALAETLSRYTLKRLHSEGGLGKIWVVHDDQINREVVLKELQQNQAHVEESRTRFLKEAQITGQLEHPNIVPVYELGRRSDGGRPYYTMRYVHGQTLGECIAQYHIKKKRGEAGPLDLSRLLNAFVSVCNAIAYAHARGVIHRDLKPENVVLGKFGEVIVLDWGLAKVVNEEEVVTQTPVDLTDSVDLKLTGAGTVLGTPAYMAPEQAQGLNHAIDTCTDVYGLGAILFEILTGRAPHSGKNVQNVITQVVQGPTPKTRSVDPNVPTALDAVCARAMAKPLGERYDTVSDLVDEVQRWLADEPVSVYRPPLSRRLLRWVRHHRTTTAVGLVVLVTLTILSANLWWQRRSAVGQELDLLANDTQQGTGALLTLIDILREDTRYLTDQAPLRELLVARRRSTSVEDTLAANQATERLATVFQEFTRHRSNYLQARLLGIDGREIVRVERKPGSDGDRSSSQPEISPEAELQNKGDRPYFARALRLAKGEVYLSEVELNREKREVETPHLPVIRSAMPVYLPGDESAQGVVIINIDVRPLFVKLEEGQKEPGRPLGRIVYVLDHRGYYLLNPDAPEKTFGFEFEGAGEEYRFSHRYPEFAGHIEQGSAARDGMAVCGRGKDRRAVYVLKLHYDTHSPDRYLWLAVAAPYSELADRAHRRYAFGFRLTLVLMIVILLAPFVLARLPRRRLRLQGTKRGPE